MTQMARLFIHHYELDQVQRTRRIYLQAIVWVTDLDDNEDLILSPYFVRWWSRSDLHKAELQEALCFEDFIKRKYRRDGYAGHPDIPKKHYERRSTGHTGSQQ